MSVSENAVIWISSCETYLGLDKVVTQFELRIESGLRHVNVGAQETGVADLR